MIQETSIESYHIEQDSGRAATLREAILNGYVKFGNCTDRELASYLSFPGRQTISPRRKELVDMGYVTEKYRRLCSKGNKMAIVWGLK